MPLVRRLPAIFLLGLFSFSLIEPALFAGADAKLPACCRREGQHHCAMTAEASAAGASVQAVCPAFPKTGATPAYSKLAGVRPLQAPHTSIAALTVIRARTETLAHSAAHRARPKRGPPALLS